MSQTKDNGHIPKEIKRLGYSRIPETCDTVRGILDVAKQEIMKDLEVPPHDEPIVDAAISRAFIAIRDQVTKVFRKDQLELLWEMDTYTKNSTAQLEEIERQLNELSERVHAKMAEIEENFKNETSAPQDQA